jgi:Flp pilus assembly protein TadG
VIRRVHPVALKCLGQRGSTLVEQALVITLLLTVMFGIVDLSQAAYAYHFVANAAREATRWASVRSPTSGLSPTANPDTIQTFVSNVPGMGLDSSSITSTTSFAPPPNGSPACVPGPASNKPGCVVQVTVNYSYKFFFPFLPTNPILMSSSSQMVITQ